MKRLMLFVLCTAILNLTVRAQAPTTQAQQPQPIKAIRAGRLIDPETGTATVNQVILVQGTRIRQIGANLALRVAIEQGWVPGPTIINSGIIIGGI